MPIRFHLWCVVGVLALAMTAAVSAQETPPDAAEPKTDEGPYAELRDSDDRVTKLTAERYYNLVRVQEWSDATGKSKVSAKYIEHDPDLKWVKLEAVRVRGGQRTVKEITVPVEKLSKTCQSRVRQINALQKRLDELASAAADEATDGVAPDHGAPMTDERGAEPAEFGRERDRIAAAAGSEIPTPTSPMHDPSAAVEFEEDPLGFAEVQLAPLPQGGPNSGALIPGMPTGASPSTRDVDRAQWASNYAAFHANFSVGDDGRGNPAIDWGELDELRTIGEASANAASDPTSRDTGVRADRLGPVRWEGTFQSFLPGEGILRMAFDLPPLPPPLDLQFRLDQEKLTMDDWNQISANAGDRLSFTGRFAMAGPTTILVFVSDPQPAAVLPR